MKTAIVVGLLAVALAGMVRAPDTTGLLPRPSGCAGTEPALTITPHAATLSHGPWCQPIFTFADWHLRGDTDADSILAAGGLALDPRAENLPFAETDAARAEVAQMTDARTLIRCPAPSLDVTALLRGTTEAPLPKRFVR